MSKPDNEIRPSSLRELLLYFLRLGTTGFGGPIALASLFALVRLKTPEPVLVLAAGMAGLLLKWR